MSQTRERKMEKEIMEQGNIRSSDKHETLARMNLVLERDNSIKFSSHDNMPARITGRIRDKLK